jgi:tetratricopeptide (TPR) repeat protein
MSTDTFKMDRNIRLARVVAWIAVIIAASATPVLSQGPGFLVVRIDQAGKIAYESYEDVTINGQNRLRAPAAPSKAFDENTYKKMGHIMLADAGVMRRTSDGVLARIDGEKGTRSLLLPDQMKIQGTLQPADAWKQAAISAKTIKKDKAGVTLAFTQVLALMPATSASTAAADFVIKEANFDGIDEHGAAIAAFAETFRKTPDAGTVRGYLNRTLQDGYAKFEDGGPFSVFLNSVRYAQFAQKAFPEELHLVKLSGDIVARRAWIDDNSRMLQSLINNRNWDSFLDRYPPFEKYQRSFPQLLDARRLAYEESARFHTTLGRNLFDQKKYVEALEQLKMAVARDPDNKPLADLMETARLKASASVATERAALRKGLPEGSSEATLFNRYLANATLFIAEKKFKEAADALNAAGELDKNSPRILLVRAKYYQGTNQLAKSVEMLDAYDLGAVTKEEKDAGESIRIVVGHALENLRADNRAKLDELMKAGRYWEALSLAARSLEVDPLDEDFLYRAGVSAAILRRKEAPALLQQYLERSNSLHGDPKAREKAQRLLALLHAPRAAPGVAGKPNWFSASVLQPGIFYCPLSLTFQTRIESIRARKMEVKFEWAADGRLRKVATSFDDAKAAQDYMARVAKRPGVAGEPQSLFFEYLTGFPQVYRVAEGQSAPVSQPVAQPVAQTGPPAVFRDSKGELTFNGEGAKPAGNTGWRYPVLLNHPMLDPNVLSLVDGPVATGMAGNSYFNPFVWDGLHVFRFQYDKLGRVESAREVGVPNLVRFEWRNDQLAGLTAYDVSDAAAERSVYRRTMTYEGALLTAETVDFAGKSYKIIYRYVSGALQEASFSDTAAHDGAERRIRFLP